MLRPSTPAFALVLVCACGARTGLGADEAAGADAGAGVRMDARPPPVRDAGSDAPPDAAACEPFTLAWTVTPTVVLLVDQSGSMGEAMPGGGTRWTLVRGALVGRPAGLVTRLEGRVRFGLALYSARSELGGMGGPPIGECPLIAGVPPALDNLDAIRSVYASAEPIEDTPTGDAIDAVRERVLATVDPRRSPTLFVLATDGEPDTCAQLDPQEGQEEAVASARRAFEQGIRTFIIAVGVDTVSRAHLQAMADAGLGRSAGGPPAPFWEAEDLGGLRRALDEIVRTGVSCEILLDRSVDPALGCLGEVRLDGRPLPCDDPDGFRVEGPRRLEILGAACDALQAHPGSVLDGSFPCAALLD